MERGDESPHSIRCPVGSGICYFAAAAFLGGAVGGIGAGGIEAFVFSQFGFGFASHTRRFRSETVSPLTVKPMFAFCVPISSFEP